MLISISFSHSLHKAWNFNYQFYKATMYFSPILSRRFLYWDWKLPNKSSLWRYTDKTCVVNYIGISSNIIWTGSYSISSMGIVSLSLLKNLGNEVKKLDLSNLVICSWLNSKYHYKNTFFTRGNSTHIKLISSLFGQAMQQSSFFSTKKKQRMKLLW